jgi:hypothetical protein
LSLYFDVYDNRELEVGYIKGDIAIKKLNTASLWSKDD